MNVDFVKENVIQIKSGILMNVDGSVKNIIYASKNIFGILVHVVAKMKNIWQILWRFSHYAGWNYRRGNKNYFNKF